MFIFSQFNFPDPKPPDSEGDRRVPGEAVQEQLSPRSKKKAGEGGFPEEEEESQSEKGALEVEWRVRFMFTTGFSMTLRVRPCPGHLASVSSSEEGVCAFVIHYL